jgi:NTP pyrophosphatase (non-canonical NTP hydrolase)
MSVFEEQAKFMLACGQTVGVKNDDQFYLYAKLIAEEVGELTSAMMDGDRAEIFDALLDIIVVCIGAGHSAGLPLEAGWREVINSNMSKVDPDTGKVLRREDGKIMKGPSYRAPDLGAVLRDNSNPDDKIHT